ncbi:MAG: hypothetical protein JSU68_13840 [Phycisphaerales bacterium]|nr:MAG: hypothetical protein JSU68_13840 [Phycisphaerales bacterium]
MATILLAFAGAAGCQSLTERVTSEPGPSVETLYPELTWNFRLTSADALPPDAAIPLNDQYQVLEIRDPGTWHRMCQALNLRDVDESPDFSRGIVVGLTATLGDPVSHRWPLRIDHLKRSGSLGSVALRVAEGLYNPTCGSPYCVLTYAPGISRLAIVRVNHRVFYLE